MTNANGAGRKGHTTAAGGPSTTLLLIVPNQCTEEAYIKAAVREARIQARASWRARTGHVVNKGGRPSLEKDVCAACAAQWELWGGKFPRNSTIGALVRKVSARLPVTHCGQPPERKDLRIITKHVNRWLGDLYLYQFPKSWFTKTPTGRHMTRIAARAAAELAALTGDPTYATSDMLEAWAEYEASLKQRADQELAQPTLSRSSSLPSHILRP